MSSTAAELEAALKSAGVSMTASPSRLTKPAMRVITAASPPTAAPQVVKYRPSADAARQTTAKTAAKAKIHQFVESINADLRSLDLGAAIAGGGGGAAVASRAVARRSFASAPNSFDTKEFKESEGKITFRQNLLLNKRDEEALPRLPDTRQPYLTASKRNGLVFSGLNPQLEQAIATNKVKAIVEGIVLTRIEQPSHGVGLDVVLPTVNACDAGECGLDLLTGNGRALLYHIDEGVFFDKKPWGVLNERLQILDRPHDAKFQSYLEEMGQFLTSVRQACAEADVDYELVRTDESLDAVLLRFLARREERRR